MDLSLKKKGTILTFFRMDNLQWQFQMFELVCLLSYVWTSSKSLDFFDGEKSKHRNILGDFQLDE